MALTDEQYRQVFRYADGEMDTDERKAFEATLAENNELRDEVHFYIQVARLGKSVEEKISNDIVFGMSPDFKCARARYH